MKCESSRKRLAPEERERIILEEATRFFAAEGFEANIRDLAKVCRVSQALIYKYFWSKEQLVERVYQQVFLKRWRQEWDQIVSDGSIPIRERLIRFYISYVDAIDDHVWIRIILHSGLSGNGLTGRYILENLEPLMMRIAAELRDDATPGPVSRRDIEHVWALHSTFIYYLIRRDVFRTETSTSREEFVVSTVDSFLDGTLPRLAPI